MHCFPIEKHYIGLSDGFGEPLDLVELKTSSVSLDIITLEVEPMLAYASVEDDSTAQAELSGSLTLLPLGRSRVPDPWE